MARKGSGSTVEIHGISRWFMVVLQAADVPLKRHVAALPALLQLAHRHAIDLRRAFKYRVRLPTPPLVTRVEHFPTAGGAV
jgi:hypothetical protein